jgi:hypothetical protein
MTFFYNAILVNLTLVFINFLGNLFSGNDCGIYSVRGFAAALVTGCTLSAYGVFLLINLFVKVTMMLGDWLKKKNMLCFASSNEE